jgi:hypothetical protein
MNAVVVVANDVTREAATSTSQGCDRSDSRTPSVAPMTGCVNAPAVASEPGVVGRLLVAEFVVAGTKLRL